jgi:hypothetical protein
VRRELPRVRILILHQIYFGRDVREIPPIGGARAKDALSVWSFGKVGVKKEMEAKVCSLCWKRSWQIVTASALSLELDQWADVPPKIVFESLSQLLIHTYPNVTAALMCDSLAVV